MTNNLRKAAEMALEGLETIKSSCREGRTAHAENEAAIVEFLLRQALAQPEQEPVTAHQALEALDELESCARGDEPFNHFAAPLVRQFIEQAVVLPKKEWVGLTNDEVNNFAAGCHLGNSVQDAIYKAEAKLKEKNT